MNTVRFTYLDGTEEEYQTPNNLALNGPVVMVSLGSGEVVAINLTQIRKWVFRQSKLAVAQSSPPKTLKAVQ